MTRACEVCAAPLDGRRADATTCSAACRRERLRLRRLRAGVPDPPYRPLAEYNRRAQRRANRSEAA